MYYYHLCPLKISGQIKTLNYQINQDPKTTLFFDIIEFSFTEEDLLMKTCL